MSVHRHQGVAASQLRSVVVVRRLVNHDWVAGTPKRMAGLLGARCVTGPFGLLLEMNDRFLVALLTTGIVLDALRCGAVRLTDLVNVIRIRDGCIGGT